MGPSKRYPLQIRIMCHATVFSSSGTQSQIAPYFMQITSVDEDAFHIEISAHNASKNVTKLFIKQSHKPSEFKRIKIGKGGISGGIDIDINSDQKHNECELTLYRRKQSS
eukprot:1132566_1